MRPAIHYLSDAELEYGLSDLISAMADDGIKSARRIRQDALDEKRRRDALSSAELDQFLLSLPPFDLPQHLAGQVAPSGPCSLFCYWKYDRKPDDRARPQAIEEGLGGLESRYINNGTKSHGDTQHRQNATNRITRKRLRAIQ